MRDRKNVDGWGYVAQCEADRRGALAFLGSAEAAEADDGAAPVRNPASDLRNL